ncbi:hypothetical protein COB57_03695 [Candidatus Peregrinibacteria bacterium]|nr:MAG: hypothetical protein COB57_03695 [Candidatus Peregrinibacteria bacterium]
MNTIKSYAEAEKQRAISVDELRLVLNEIDTTIVSGISAETLQKLRTIQLKAGCLEELVSEEKKKYIDLLSQGELSLRDVPLEFRKDKDVVLVAVGYDGMALLHTCYQLKNDREVVAVALSNNVKALQYASAEMRDDKDIIMEAVFYDKKAVKYASSRLIEEDKDVKRAYYVSLVSEDANAFFTAPEDMRYDKEVVLAAAFCSDDSGEIYFILDSTSVELRDDIEVVMAVITQEGLGLMFVSDRLRGCKEVVKAAILSGGCIKDASKELRGDKELMIEAVSRYGSDIEYASDELRNDKEVVMAALTVSELQKDPTGHAFDSFSQELQKDEDVIRAAKRK